MAGKSFQFTLTTPQGKVLDIPAAGVQFPAHDGMVGILPGRAPLVMKLGIGALRVDVADSSKGAGGTRSFLIEEGFAHMVGAKLTLLTSRATPAESLTAGETDSALSKAESNKPTDKVGRDRAAKELERARAAVRLVRGGKGGI
jgi:F-type H+-transporting ATPase subunit epsilon